MAFGRLQRPGASQPMSEINMTPLIDVMLVLLVIFIITAPLMSSSRAGYAQGSLRAARFLAGHATGLFDMNDVLGLA